MSILTFTYTFTAGTTAQSSQVNANFTSVATVVNGNLDNTNLSASAGIVATKLNLTSEFMNLRAANNRGFSGGVTGDTVPRVAQNSRGSIDFGPGSSTAMDVSIVRVDSNTLGVRDQANAADKNFTVGALTFSDTSAGTALLQVLRSTNNNCVAVGVTGDTNPRAALNSRGSLDFGGGSGALDLAVTREDANTLAVRDQSNSTYKNLKVGVLTPTTAISAVSGGTGQDTYTVGDILVCQTTDTLSKLPKGSDGTFVGVSGGTVGYYATGGGLFKAASISSTARTLPTSGALSGIYIHFGNWTSTGNLTFAHGTRIYIKGNVSLGHDLVGTAQSNGGTNSGFVGPGANGAGLSPGTTGVYQYGGGAGGGNGGAGGRGAFGSASNLYSSAPVGGPAHSVFGVGGSGGGAGAGSGTSGQLGANGGGGGPAISWEIDGTYTQTSGTFSALGANGAVATSTGGAGGGGAGGDIDIAATGAINQSGGTISVAGGNGGNYTSSGLKGGGGGGGKLRQRSGSTVTNSGTITYSGGNKGTGTDSTIAATDGSSGSSEVRQNEMPISLY